MDTDNLLAEQVGNTSTAAMNAFDCVNATLVDSAQLNNPMNLSHLTALFYDGLQSRRLPPLNGHHVPLESELTIYNRSKLLVNLEVGFRFRFGRLSVCDSFSSFIDAVLRQFAARRVPRVLRQLRPRRPRPQGAGPVPVLLLAGAYRVLPSFTEFFFRPRHHEDL